MSPSLQISVNHFGKQFLENAAFSSDISGSCPQALRYAELCWLWACGASYMPQSPNPADCAYMREAARKAP